MLTSLSGTCNPTTKQIRQDLGLASLTIVFESMSVLEQHGFILRQRRKIERLNSRRNVYQRPSCEYTVLRLLELGKIDGLLRPVPGSVNETSEESRELKEVWLRNLMAEGYGAYQAAPLEDKREMLIETLRRDVNVTANAT